MVSSRPRALARALAVAVVAATPVTLLALAVREQTDSVFTLDDRVLDAATALARDNHGLRDALFTWQAITQPLWLNLACTGLCLWTWRRYGMTTRSLWAFGTLMTVWGGQLLLKVVVQRARPLLQDPVSHAPGYSFPSGHAANTTGAVVVVLLLVWPLLRTTAARVVALAAGLAVVLVTGADRVLLGVHYPSDVVGGFLVGGGIALTSWAAFGPLNRATRDTATPDEEPV